MTSWVLSAVSAVAGGVVSAVSAIAGSAASAVVERIVDAGFSYLSKRMLPTNSEVELKRLETALPQIREVMGIAEALKVKDPSLGSWFEQFRNAVEASEDMLDELEYRRLEDMVKLRDEANRSASRSKKKKSCLINDDTLRRLREVVKMLDKAAANVKHIHQRATQLGVRGLSEVQQEIASKVLRRETTSFLTEREVFGREVEKHKIISWLKQPTHDHLSCFSIVGGGGLGKTCLAQVTYQEMGASNHFDKRIWVCVSNNFTVEDVTRKMLGELGETSCDNKPLNALQERLKENVHSKNFFLVLDDIWDDDNRSAWEQLIAPLKFVQEGSKILFTTRMKSVADLLTSVINIEESQSLALQGLPEKDLLRLFNSHAFCGFNPDNFANLKAIRDQIVRMLKGSPLAAKVIGSLLNTRMDHLYWRRVMEHGSLFNIGQAKDVIEVLKLSYYHLPVDLQVCFRFCSIFPQDYLFEKNELIKMWMSFGFLRQQSPQKERLEDIGDDYFNHLLRKSFFEYSHSFDGEVFYVMHDLMHELAQNVSEGECYRVEPNDKLALVPSTVRHISVHESEIGRVSHLENLRSLVIIANANTSTNSKPFVLSNILIKKPLRLLKISTYSSCQLSEDIGCLVHLRYLSVNINYASQSFKWLFPASIHKLYHLNVLEILRDGYNSSYLGIDTTRLTDLVSLQYLTLPQDIRKTIHGVHKLTSLKDLAFFVGKKCGFRINELATLKNLHRVKIFDVENVVDLAEAKIADLLGKENLMTLSLRWSLDSNPDNPEHIIDCLKPNPNLMELTIVNYKGQRSPNWMADSPPLNLSSLTLLNCPLWKGQLFSCQMPYLRTLVLFDCPNLEKLPDLPLSLIELYAWNVGLNYLPCLSQNSDNNTPGPLSLKSSLTAVEIKLCPNLISLHGFLQQGNTNLQAIEKLAMENCEKLIELPTQGFGNLTSLKCFIVRNCPNLVAMDFQSNLLPERLQTLRMENCCVLDVPLIEASSRLTTLTELDISECANITLLTISENSFRSLESLSIRKCRKLVELLFLGEEDGYQENNFHVSKSKMNHLIIFSCPNPTRFSNLPLSLTILDMHDVAVSSLPEYNTSFNSSGDQSTLSPKSSLRKLKMWNCPNLTSLNGFLQQEYIDFQSLKNMYIRDFKNLVHLPASAFEKFVSLKELTILDCPMLVEFDTKNNLFPTTLESLSMENCGALDAQLLESASRLTALTELSIKNCANITHIPCSEISFVSLSKLVITGCDKLVEQAECVKLKENNFVSLKVHELTIDPLSLLLIEPLRSLKFVGKLDIRNCSGMDMLPEQWFLQNISTLSNMRIWNASSLKSLPATIARLTALEELHIRRADLLEDLPGLPSSLRILSIWDAFSLRSLPATMASLPALEVLVIEKSDLLHEIPELPSSLKVKSISQSDGVELFAKKSWTLPSY